MCSSLSLAVCLYCILETAFSFKLNGILPMVKINNSKKKNLLMLYELLKVNVTYTHEEIHNATKRKKNVNRTPMYWNGVKKVNIYYSNALRC